jgi:hypothetical protein
MEGSEGGLLASELPVAPSQPVRASGCRVACGGLIARSQWRARAGLSPGFPVHRSLGFVAGTIAQCPGASGRIAGRRGPRYGGSRHVVEGTRWESGTDAQRYGQQVG